MLFLIFLTFSVNSFSKLINLDFVVPELEWIFDIKFIGTLFSDPVDVDSPGVGTMSKFYLKLFLNQIN